MGPLRSGALFGLTLRAVLGVLEFAQVLRADRINCDAIDYREFALDAALDGEVAAGAALEDAWYRAGVAQRAVPGPLVLWIALDEAAFFNVASAEIIGKEIRAINRFAHVSHPCSKSIQSRSRSGPALLR
jgi:hypothetical protein